jgi:hypothetical protein
MRLSITRTGGIVVMEIVTDRNHAYENGKTGPSRKRAKTMFNFLSEAKLLNENGCDKCENGDCKCLTRDDVTDKGAALLDYYYNKWVNMPIFQKSQFDANKFWQNRLTDMDNVYNQKKLNESSFTVNNIHKNKIMNANMFLESVDMNVPDEAEYGVIALNIEGNKIAVKPVFFKENGVICNNKVLDYLAESSYAWLTDSAKKVKEMDEYTALSHIKHESHALYELWNESSRLTDIPIDIVYDAMDIRKALNYNDN